MFLAAPPFADLPYVIEPMQVSDIDAVMTIDRQAFSTPWSHSAYHHEITKNDAAHYFILRPRVAGSNGASRAASNGGWRRMRRWLAGAPTQARPPIVAYAGLWQMYDEAHISTIAVHSGWRGRGLGELMLLVMLYQGVELQANVVTLEVRVSNEVAQSLYHKYGFDIVGRRKGYYSDNNEDAFLMTTPSLADEPYRAEIAALAEALRRRLTTQSQPVMGR